MSADRAVDGGTVSRSILSWQALLGWTQHRGLQARAVSLPKLAQDAVQRLGQTLLLGSWLASCCPLPKRWRLRAAPQATQQAGSRSPLTACPPAASGRTGWDLPARPGRPARRQAPQLSCGRRGACGRGVAAVPQAWALPQPSRRPTGRAPAGGAPVRWAWPCTGDGAGRENLVKPSHRLAGRQQAELFMWDGCESRSKGVGASAGLARAGLSW